VPLLLELTLPRFSSAMLLLRSRLGAGSIGVLLGPEMGAFSCEPRAKEVHIPLPYLPTKAPATVACALPPPLSPGDGRCCMGAAGPAAVRWLRSVHRALSMKRPHPADAKTFVTSTTLTGPGGQAMGDTIVTTTTVPVTAKEAADPAMLVGTWNLAAINNNPFEYWITHTDAAYNKLMVDVQNFIDNPGARDVRVDSVFTAEMFGELSADMEAVGLGGVAEVAAMWEAEYRGRSIVKDFMKDRAIGNKRLASMPDRMTNTINTLDEGAVCRPTIINCYAQRMDCVADWWRQWQDFMFHKSVKLKTKTGEESVPVWSMLQPIHSSKYPAVTAEEEKVSIPLQLLCQAIFDAILVHTHVLFAA
jgi:hypothetical protein